ncbi:MAG: RNA 2',3'-cyclic phosphodiesterase [Eubacteriales bacterium]|nr:RNA 2',3'-cyclic phosphodiesterase [Eubacteriales bacterium]
MRMFFAAPLPRDVRRTLSEAQSRLISLSPGARFVPPENFHITMQFIGESNAIAEAATACREAVRGISPISLKLGEYGCFSQGSGNTGFMGLTGNCKELELLYRSLQTALLEQGFSLGRQRFVPHITLARGLALEQDAASVMEGAGNAHPFTVSELALFESKNINGHMVYTALHREKL